MWCVRQRRRRPLTPPATRANTRRSRLAPTVSRSSRTTTPRMLTCGWRRVPTWCVRRRPRRPSTRPASSAGRHPSPSARTDSRSSRITTSRMVIFGRQRAAQRLVRAGLHPRSTRPASREGRHQSPSARTDSRSSRTTTARMVTCAWPCPGGPSAAAEYLPDLGGFRDGIARESPPERRGHMRWMMVAVPMPPPVHMVISAVSLS